MTYKQVLDEVCQLVSQKSGRAPPGRCSRSMYEGAPQQRGEEGRHSVCCTERHNTCRAARETKSWGGWGSLLLAVVCSACCCVSVVSVYAHIVCLSVLSHCLCSHQANYLRSVGVKKGDAVSIYMPMVCELPIAMLACARIGAVHSVVFGGFSAEALAGGLSGRAVRDTLSQCGRGPHSTGLTCVC